MFQTTCIITGWWNYHYAIQDGHLVLSKAIKTRETRPTLPDINTGTHPLTLPHLVFYVCCSFKSLLKIVDLKVLGTEVVFIMTVKGTQEEIAKILNAQDNYVWFDMFPLNENLYLITITTHCHLRDVSFASIAHGVAKSCG